MKNIEVLSIIEGILFAMGEPVSIQEIAEAIDLDINETKQLITELIEQYKNQSRGMQVKLIKSKVQMCTLPEHYPYITGLITERNKTGLSQAALETLSIIAYKQPVTRIEIEVLRGVKSSSSIQTLIDRNLIYEAGRLDAPGKPILYETTLEFLKYAGISSIKELPDYEIFVEGIQEQIE